MKNTSTLLPVGLALVSIVSLEPSALVHAATTINPVNKYAYGANLGWLSFENTGAPRVDLTTGIPSGRVWSANCGWISLSNAVAYVQTDSIAPGADTDSGGIVDAWDGGLSFTDTNAPSFLMRFYRLMAQ